MARRRNGKRYAGGREFLKENRRRLAAGTAVGAATGIAGHKYTTKGMEKIHGNDVEVRLPGGRASVQLTSKQPILILAEKETMALEREMIRLNNAVERHFIERGQKIPKFELAISPEEGVTFQIMNLDYRDTNQLRELTEFLKMEGVKAEEIQRQALEKSKKFMQEHGIKTKEELVNYLNHRMGLTNRELLLSAAAGGNLGLAIALSYAVLRSRHRQWKAARRERRAAELAERLKLVKEQPRLGNGKKEEKPLPPLQPIRKEGSRTVRMIEHMSEDVDIVVNRLRLSEREKQILLRSGKERVKNTGHSATKEWLETTAEEIIRRRKR